MASAICRTDTIAPQVTRTCLRSQTKATNKGRIYAHLIKLEYAIPIEDTKRRAQIVFDQVFQMISQFKELSVDVYTGMDSNSPLLGTINAAMGRIEREVSQMSAELKKASDEESAILGCVWRKIVEGSEPAQIEADKAFEDVVNTLEEHVQKMLPGQRCTLINTSRNLDEILPQEVAYVIEVGIEGSKEKQD